MNAMLKILQLRVPVVNWVDHRNCGSNNGRTTIGTNGNDTQNGKDWMKDVCSNPP